MEINEQSIDNIARKLYKDGRRAEEKDLIMSEYALTVEDTDLLCDKLIALELCMFLDDLSDTCKLRRIANKKLS